MILEQHYLGCLSQASYFIGDEESGTAAVVDPRRDVDEYLEKARDRGLTIRHVLLTHFHADFISGHLELRRNTNATIYIGAAGTADYPFTPLSDGESIEFGKVRIQALATPGHTPESTSFLVFDLGQDRESPHAVLTGDTLFIGDVGRPDLMASRGITAEELAGQLYDSLREKILTLPDRTILFPGHGAGSACGKNLGSETSCTIGRQRSSNYALQPMSRNEFVRLVTAGQPKPPRYFPFDAQLNKEERPHLDEVLERALKPLSLEQVLALHNRGARILDVRGADEFARLHLNGSFNVGLKGKFASWVGTVLRPEDALVIVAAPGEEREAITRLGRIGMDQVAGYLEDGIDALKDRADLGGSFQRLSLSDLAGDLDTDTAPLVLDIRAPGEREEGHIADSLHIPLSELQERLDEIPRDRSIVVHCSGGYRSAIAASLLRNHGLASVGDLRGGYGAWKDAGHPTVPGAVSPSARAT
jgi:glyoxylase-like metal-dependent hydrolase (beta-lactamase superfamily II)/rhodanese-related sulfurtransferase